MKPTSSINSSEGKSVPALAVLSTPFHNCARGTVPLVVAGRAVAATENEQDGLHDLLLEVVDGESFRPCHTAHPARRIALHGMHCLPGPRQTNPRQAVLD